MLERNAILQTILLAALILTFTAPPLASASKSMFMQATLNPTQTQQGVYVVINGRILDASGSPVSNAIVSIQVTNPEATTIHLAVAYSTPNGTFQDNFLIPVNSPGGNYTAYLVADKPGFNTASVTLGFNYSSPDFSLEPTASQLILRQGDVGKFAVTIVSIRGFRDSINLTALNVPSGVTVQYSPASVTPTGNTEVTVTVSQTAAVGNFTITLLAVSGSTIHSVSFQLVITAGPIQAVYVALPAILAIAILLAFSLQRRRRRYRKRAMVEELLKASEADRGYVATARVIARLEELRATNQVDEATYQRLRKENEKRLMRSK